jgi:hypothetical protein
MGEKENEKEKEKEKQKQKEEKNGNAPHVPAIKNKYEVDQSCLFILKKEK